MTKAKGRARAKERARAKAGKPKTKGEKHDAAQRPGHYDAKSSAMRSISGGSNIKASSGMKRGAARSR